MAEKKRVSNKGKKIRVAPGKPYYSSKDLRKGFDQRLASALAIEDLKEHSPFGEMSPQAGIANLAAEGVDLLRPEEGKRGARLAKKMVKEAKQKGLKEGGRAGEGKTKTQGINRSKRTGFSGRGTGAALRGF
tara:strand:+ start:70 stop:465 length:396 start_codon:yes stop_codon:yes gene_type:complete